MAYFQREIQTGLSPAAPSDIEGALKLCTVSQNEFTPEQLIAMQIQEALRHARKMETVGQMAAGIAHDFNNLLQGVGLALDAMQHRLDQGRTEEIASLVTATLTSVNKAGALAHRLLAFSRPHAVDWKPVGVNSVIASLQTMLSWTLGDRIELELILADDLATTICDPHQLENAVLNLAINAKDAMPDGGKLVIETCHADLSTERDDLRKGRYVGICVSDNGTGMRPDVAKRAFDPFYTTKPEGRGTGLGLAMTKQFVKQFDGGVNIVSVVGRGTSIMLYLPCHRANAGAEKAIAGCQA
jgi:signal transduction histidine kinase